MRWRLFLFMLCIACSFSTAVFAQTVYENEEGQTAVISASVPYSHAVTVSATGAEVFCGDVSGNTFTVDRPSKPTLLIRAESGREIAQVFLNDEDITSQIKGGCYSFAPVYEDKTLTVITEDEPTVSQSKT